MSRSTITSRAGSRFAIAGSARSPARPGPTACTRFAARAAGSRDDLPPLYSQPSFARHPDAHGITWRWYSFEAGTLRFADAQYTLGHHDRFAFFSTTNLNWKTGLDGSSYNEVANNGYGFTEEPALPDRWQSDAFAKLARLQFYADCPVAAAASAGYSAAWSWGHDGKYDDPDDPDFYERQQKYDDAELEMLALMRQSLSIPDVDLTLPSQVTPMTGARPFS
jgi:hypothetical protein